MNSQMMTYFCVAYGPASVSFDARRLRGRGAFRRAQPLGVGREAASPGIIMIHRDIDAPVAVGISQCLEKSDVAAPRDELQKGDPGRAACASGASTPPPSRRSRR